MHILYFHQHFSTPSGATGIRSYEMARRLVERGHRVTMVCGSYGAGSTGLDGPFRRGRRRELVHGIDVIEFDLAYANSDGLLKRSTTFLRYAFGSIGVALSQRCDLVFATTTPLTAGLPGIAARWLRAKPFVFEVRDLWPELPRALGAIRNPLALAALSALEWLSYRSAHRCIALSPGIAAGIARRGVPESRIATIPNGCDLDIFATESVSAWRPDDVQPGALLAVFTGTHGQANGLDALLDAAAVLKRRGRNDIRLLLVGDGKLKPALIARVGRERLDNVQFHSPVGKTRLAGLMAGADLGMQLLADVPAFYYGTSPNKFFDYIAAGLPVLNNYPGWLADMISRSGCGFVVPPRDAAAFADALEQAADDRPALAARGKHAAELGRSEFDRSRLADQWIAWVAEMPTP